MANFSIDVNENINLTAKLEKLHRSAFPSAVRNTLNNAAFEVRNKIPEVAASLFTIRSKSFFKAFTRVNKAQGFNITSMSSVVGINAQRNRKLAGNLAAQETGGAVNGRKLIAHDKARTSSSSAKKVSRRNYINKIQIHNANRAYRGHKGSKNSKFIAAVYSTVRSGKKHMQLDNGSKGMVYEVSGLSQTKTTRNINFKIKKLYSYNPNSRYKAKPNRFLKKSSILASKEIPNFYKKNAEFQFKKALKK